MGTGGIGSIRGWRASLVAVAVASSGAVGCVQRPEAPPAPRALTISAQRGQSQARQDRDKAECQSIASAQATSSATWAQAFAACMGPRGYAVY